MDKELEDAIAAFKETNGTLAGIKLKRLICHKLGLYELTDITPQQAVDALKIIAEAAPETDEPEGDEPGEDGGGDEPNEVVETPEPEAPKKTLDDVQRDAMARLNAPRVKRAAGSEAETPAAPKGELPDAAKVYARMNAARKPAAAK